VLTSASKDTASVTASMITMEIRHEVGVQTSWGKKAEAAVQQHVHTLDTGGSLCYRNIESFLLEKTLKIESNCKPNTANSTTKPRP